MPQYIRENGAIRVIPDDNTTEDGEIDLSPKRKIIDEGNIVIEGRNDGSVAIRERLVKDQTFLGSNVYQIFQTGSAQFADIEYIPSLDLYVLCKQAGGAVDALSFIDPDTGNIEYSLNTSSGEALEVVYSPISEKLIVSDQSSVLTVVDLDGSSTGGPAIENEVSISQQSNTLSYDPKTNQVINVRIDVGFFDGTTGSELEIVSTTAEVFRPREVSKVFSGICLFNQGGTSSFANVNRRTVHEFDLFFNSATYSKISGDWFAVDEKETDSIYRLDGNTLQIKDTLSFDFSVQETSQNGNIRSTRDGMVFWNDTSNNKIHLINPQELEIKETVDYGSQGFENIRYAKHDPGRNRILLTNQTGSNDAGIYAVDYTPFN
jgi:hypothetical protein